MTVGQVLGVSGEKEGEKERVTITVDERRHCEPGRRVTTRVATPSGMPRRSRET
jgi:hypothetical protein